MTHPPIPRHVLPVLVTAQFAGTSLWFAVNAVMPDLQQAYGWAPEQVGILTSVLQLGFILGTLVFALWSVADRFSARRVFLGCALAGSACTLLAWWRLSDPAELAFWRLLTGFCLAGIYPVGMKIAAQWYRQGLGSALGLLVGALVLGSASPHALRAMGQTVPWDWVMPGVALLAAAGGVGLYLLLGDPPHAPPRAQGLQWTALASLWTHRRVRASVLGYFGHMWELYTVWVLVPLLLQDRLQGVAVSWTAFAVIGAGSLGCALGGQAALRWGSARVARAMLACSGVCCLLAPWMAEAADPLFYGWLLVWGVSVAGDSPQLSTLTARNAPLQAVGSVLTLTNSLGFALSIVSILLFVGLARQVPVAELMPWLAPGPLLGLWALRALAAEEVPGPKRL